MADSSTPLDLLQVQQADPALPANGNFDAASGAMVFARRQSRSGGLDWAWYGGRIHGTVVPNGAGTLTQDAINYITCNRATMAVTIATTGYNWADPVNHARLYRVQHTGGVVTYEDHRFGRFGLFGEAMGGAPSAVLLQWQVNQPATALATGASQAVMRAPFAGRLARLRASVSTASTSGLVTLDVRVGSLSMFGANKLTIDANETSTTTAATAPDIVEQMDIVADDEVLAINVDGAGTGAAGLRASALLLPFSGDAMRDNAALVLTMQGANGGGVFADASRHARTVTRINTITTSTAVADPWGGGLSSADFGTTQERGFRCAWAPTLNFRGVDFDIAVWLRFTTYGCTVLDCRGDGPYTGANSSWFWYVSADRRLGVRDSAQSITVMESSANVAPVATTWFHARLSKRGANTRLFVDGVQVATTGTWNPSNTASTGIRVLHGDAGDANTLKGNARDFVILHGVSRYDGAHTPPRRAYIA